MRKVARWAIFAALACGSTAAAAADRLVPNSLIMPGAGAAPKLLGSSAVPLRAERFSEEVARVREDASKLPRLKQLIAPATGLSREQQMEFVQRTAHASIRWISDATEWGRHDYWASAAQTLAHGAGDAEDRAIVKMHALRALGFNNSDLFITLARDRVAGPISVLLVRLAGKYYVLDDTGGRPFPVEQRSKEFQPLMSFGVYGSWVHVPSMVRPNASTAAAAFAAK